MKFIIAGAGGVGGIIGASLARAGHEVSWLARGRNLAALRTTGLSVESPLGNFTLGPQQASDDARELGAADAVIVAVKLYDLAALAPRLAPLATPDTLLLPLQNGIEGPSILAAALPGARVLKGMVVVKAALSQPGRVVCKSGFVRIRMGGRAGLEALAGALNSGNGMTATVSPDIDGDLWRKFVMLASFSAVSCLARASIGAVLDNRQAFDLLLQAVAEATSVAGALGVQMPANPRDIVEPQIKDLPREGKPSMLEDLEAGRPLELDFLSGTVVRLGREHGVPTPVHATACSALAMHSRPTGV
jgi:2-dehydropantoate 2-reductase